jgi:hypothetical protein
MNFPCMHTIIAVCGLVVSLLVVDTALMMRVWC